MMWIYRVVSELNSLGSEIKRLRKERSFLTQEELADKIGFSRTYLADTENDRKIPSITFLNKVAAGLGISKLHLYKAAGYLDETDILNLVDENKRLREALEFYADRKTYHTAIDVSFGGGRIFVIDEDKGKIARDALEGE